MKEINVEIHGSFDGKHWVKLRSQKNGTVTVYNSDMDEKLFRYIRIVEDGKVVEEKEQ